MLEVSALCAWYGRAQALHELSLSVADAETVVLLGRNGAGKSTALKAIAGLLRPVRGEVRFAGRRIDPLAPWRIARLGLGYVPEERRIFTDLTVLENLAVGRQPARAGLSPWTFARIVALFPNLGEVASRRGGEISGGEQQMLAIARTLMGNPSTLLLDEPTEGLAPVIVEQVAAALRDLKRDGVAVLLSEQNLRFAEAVADRAYVIESGQLRYAGAMASFARDAAARSQYLGLD
ncbi:MAG TPA: ABC transporter ATP-binding protein [Casimicrobiaceae bacterium]|jgi:branched-chain amino acid transport system ATP-binding protein|nr:ABC transporter ATP-binding protein [Casimicrobiaceae bacterium]